MISFSIWSTFFRVFTWNLINVCFTSISVWILSSYKMIFFNDWLTFAIKKRRSSKLTMKATWIFWTLKNIFFRFIDSCIIFTFSLNLNFLINFAINSFSKMIEMTKKKWYETKCFAVRKDDYICFVNWINLSSDESHQWRRNKFDHKIRNLAKIFWRRHWTMRVSNWSVCENTFSFWFHLKAWRW